MADVLSRADKHAKLFLICEKHRDADGNLDSSADSPCELEYRAWLETKNPPTNWRSLSVSDIDDYMETKKPPARQKGEQRIFLLDIELVQDRKKRITVREEIATKQQWLLYMNVQEETFDLAQEDHAEEMRYARRNILAFESDTETTIEMQRRVFGWKSEEDKQKGDEDQPPPSAPVRRRPISPRPSGRSIATP